MVNRNVSYAWLAGWNIFFSCIYLFICKAVNTRRIFSFIFNVFMYIERHNKSKETHGGSVFTWRWRHTIDEHSSFVYETHFFRCIHCDHICLYLHFNNAHQPLFREIIGRKSLARAFGDSQDWQQHTHSIAYKSNVV